PPPGHNYDYLSTFFFQYYRAHRVLHSFPTRRSSDLGPLKISFLLITWDNYGDQHRLFRPKITLIFASQPITFIEMIYLSDIGYRSEEHTSELQSRENLVCRLLLEKKKHLHLNAYTLT